MRTVHVLQNLQSTYPDLTLLVPEILCKLLHVHMNHGDTTSLAADAHLDCWNYEETTEQEAGQGVGPDGCGRRSIAFDGTFVYVTNSSLTQLLKIGTGKHGTIR